MMKQRQIKLFNEKFIINSEKILKSDEKELSLIIYDFLKKNKYHINNDILKRVLQQKGLYNGSFYAIRGYDYLGFNLERYCEESFKLKGNNEYVMKVFVVKYDGSNALVCFIYGDIFSRFLYDIIQTKDLLIQNNIVYHINELE